MSQLRTSLIKIFKKSLTYSKFINLRRNIDFLSCSSTNVPQEFTACIQLCRYYGDEKFRDRKPLRKLHNRILTEDEMDADRKLSEFVTNVDKEDSFGNYKETFQDYDKIDEPDGKVGRSKKNRPTESTPEDLRMREKKAKRIDMNGKEISHQPHKTKWQTQSRSEGYSKKSFQSKYKDLSHSNRRNRKEFDVDGRETHEWSETFGTLSPAKKQEEEEIDFEEEKVIKPHIRLSKKGRRFVPGWYSRKIKEFGEEGKVKEAITVFEEWMLVNDRVMPSKEVVVRLLTILAKVGYVKKAFSVFNQAKKLGLQPNQHMYSALFNACANSPYPEQGLERATQLLEEIGVRNVEPNSTLFNTMVKAFAMCGDPKTAFLLTDKYISAHILDEKAYSHVMMAAITDKKAGFFYAVQTWRWMLMKRVKPTIQLYNLLLRVIKECGVGDQQLALNLLQPISPVSTMKYFKKEIKAIDNKKQIQESETKLTDLKSHSTGSDVNGRDTGFSSVSVSQCSNNNLKNQNYKTVQESQSSQMREIAPFLPEVKSPAMTLRSTGQLPNVLNINEDYSHIMSVDNISSPEHRFAMVGGITGFLSNMEQYNVKPSIETFDQMLSLIPPESEQHLLDIMKNHNIKPDIDFLSTLAHKRCLRKDYASAQDVLDLVADYNVVPNMRTYSILAMSCSTIYKARQLLKSIEAAGMVPDITVFGALVRRSSTDFPYKRELLERMSIHNVMPDYRMLKCIEYDIKKARMVLIKMERAERTHTNEYKELDYNFTGFKEFYETWLKKMELYKPEHPFASFKKKVTASEK